MTTPRPVILDCDPGLDDAIAILLALGSPAEIELVAITTVAGNVALEHTERNARRILALAGRGDIPVHAGCPRPILRAPSFAHAVHGDSGLDGAGLPDEPPFATAPGHAVDIVVEQLIARPSGSVTLCAIGPLTNIALAIVKSPEIVPRIGEIVLMGGSIGMGNATAAAEFNMLADPHAARIVLGAGAPVTMFPLEVTHRVLVTRERLAAIAAIGGRIADAVVGMMEVYGASARRRGLAGPPLHDPCVVAHLIRPELFAGRRCHVDIETANGPGIGATHVDWWDRGGRAANATVMREADADGVFALLAERLATLVA